MTCFQIYFYSLILFNSIVYLFDSIFHLNSIFLIYNLFDISMKYFFEIFIILYNKFFSFAIIVKACSYFLSYLSITIFQYMQVIKSFNSLIFFFLFVNICILYFFFVNNILIIFH